MAQPRQEEPKQQGIQGGEESAGEVSGEGPKIDSFFQIPDGVNIPPEGVSVMNRVGKEWQGNVTKAIQKHTDENARLKQENDELRRQVILNEEAARAWEEAIQNPQFAAFYDTISRGGQYQTPVHQPPVRSPEVSPYEGVEGAEVLQHMEDRIVERVLAATASEFDNRFAPIQQMIGQTRMQADLVALQEYAKQVDGPDPNDERIQKQMAFLRSKHKTLAMNEIYDLVRVKMGNVQPMGNSGQSNRGGGTPASATIPPTGTAVVGSPLRGKTPLEIAQSIRYSKEGQRGARVRDTLQEVIGEFSERTGIGATLDDLSR